jgi:predicted transposase YbfD/YdcC
MENKGTSLIAHLLEIEDPRIDRTRRHKLLDILVIAICAVICGADDWVEVELFGQAKEVWLRTILELPNGIPSHDTFGRVFARIDPEQFRNSFMSWVQAVQEVLKGQVIAVDGKELRGSKDGNAGKSAIDMVSAWATANQIVLGQQKVHEKSNEITAIPKLLQLLELEGCIVTIDAIGCQTEIVEQIVQKNADYVLALKENQGRLYEDAELAFKDALQNGWRDIQHDYHRTEDSAHGRREVRQCWTISGNDYLCHLRGAANWKNLHTIAMIVSEREEGASKTIKTRYFISSLENNAQKLLSAKRTHWGIENSLHWCLDIAFREDDCRVRKGNGADNLAILRHMAMNLLKQEKSARVGIKAKRHKAAWDDSYLLKVLSL